MAVHRLLHATSDLLVNRMVLHVLHVLLHTARREFTESMHRVETIAVVVVLGIEGHGGRSRWATWVVGSARLVDLPRAGLVVVVLSVGTASTMTWTHGGEDLVDRGERTVRWR